ncbi:MAG: hypothetical protein Salg2KO_13300 [Salibacteraceae bacterium]
MNKFSIFLSVFTISLVVSLNSCKRGNSILVVDQVDSTQIVPFDTFNFPTEEYFFYGKMDGDYVMWQNGKRSKWDTTTVFPNNPGVEYTKNIYYNFTELDVVDDCGPDSVFDFVEHYSYFIRPGDPFQRLEIYFYDCIDPNDVDNPYFPLNFLSAIQMGANPFSSPEYGRKGVKVRYIDENLETWETRDGSGQLADTYFRITDFQMRDIAVDTLDTFALYSVGGEFAGRLFNGTEEKTIIDAKFNVRLVPREPF